MKKFLLYLFATIILLVVAMPTQAARLYWLPAQSSAVAGEDVAMQLWLDAQGQVVNAADITVRFDPLFWQFRSFSRSSSVFSLWIGDPAYNAATGRLHLIGGTPSGFGGNQLVGTAYVQAKQSGSTEVTVDPSTQILLHDGKATVAPLTTSPAAVTITSVAPTVPQVTSPTHPQSEQWYADNNVTMQWSSPADVPVSYVFTQDPTAVPDTQAEQAASSVSYPDVIDGIYYFILRKELTPGQWSESQRFMIKIDHTPPTYLVIQRGQSPSIYDNRFFVSFDAQDNASSVAYFELSENNGAWASATSPYLLQDQSEQVVVRVRAYDYAGNMAEATLGGQPAAAGDFGVMWKLIRVLVAVILVLFFYLLVRNRRSQGRSGKTKK